MLDMSNVKKDYDCESYSVACSSSKLNVCEREERNAFFIPSAYVCCCEQQKHLSDVCKTTPKDITEVATDTEAYLLM